MRIAVFYHAILSATDREIEFDYALDLIIEQMTALKASGLADNADEIHVGVNGSFDEAMIIASICPEKANIIRHGMGRHSEIPTMNYMHNWAKTHQDWAMLYHHVKSVSTARQADAWRRRMEHHVVWDWKQCVAYLEHGREAVGCHWLMPHIYPQMGKTPFFGGNFFWATGKFLSTLPPLPPDTWENRYDAESWIGKGPRPPRAEDVCPGWPSP